MGQEIIKGDWSGIELRAREAAHPRDSVVPDEQELLCRAVGRQSVFAVVPVQMHSSSTPPARPPAWSNEPEKAQGVSTHPSSIPSSWRALSRRWTRGRWAGAGADVAGQREPLEHRDTVTCHAARRTNIQLQIPSCVQCTIGIHAKADENKCEVHF